MSAEDIKNALTQRFKRENPNVTFTCERYVSTIEENLLDGVEMSDFEKEFEQGDGNELCKKICAVHSSSALVVNSFAPFKRNLSDLVVDGKRDFTNLYFEKKYPAIKRKPPNLDVVLENDNIIGIESKFTEHLSKAKMCFSDSYNEQIKDERRDGMWFKEMQRLKKYPNSYYYLNVAQLIKHAFGLSHTDNNKNKPAMLLYLYWEPTNAEQYQNFIDHRKEIEKFSCKVAGDKLSFKAISYAELWRTWENASAPLWLSKHVKQLRNRYEISVDARNGN